MTARLAAPLLALAILPATGLCAGELPDGAMELIEGSVGRSAPPMAKAIELANRGAKSDKNFVVFLKELKKHGFSAPTPRPPWADEPEHEDPDLPKKELTEEEKQEKARKHEEMVEASRKRIGTYEINYFKEFDKNRDTKTDAAEIATAIRDYLVFEVNDHLVNIDGNHDGKLTLQEFALSVPAEGRIGEDGVDWHQREHFLESDKDDSGFIEVGEVLSWYIENIHKRSLRSLLVFQLAGHDADGDGKLDRQEFAAIAEGADALYATIFEEGESLEISKAYARLFWVPSEALEKLVKF